MNRRLFLAAAAATGFVRPAFGQTPGRFFVNVTGAGPDVILIPGLGCSAAVWDETVARISANYRCHAVQVAGFAGAPAGANTEPPIIGGVVEELAAYAAGLPAPPSVIGHSIGGLTGMLLAARHPAAVGRLLVIDALPFYPLVMSPMATVEMARPQAQMMREQFVSMSDALYRQRQELSVVNLVKTAQRRPAIMDWTLQSDRAVFAEAVYEAMTLDARPELGAIAAPTRVVYAWDPAMGMSGEMMDGTQMAAFDGLNGVELKRIDNSFHFIMYDQPEAFADEVDAFLT